MLVFAKSYRMEYHKHVVVDGEEVDQFIDDESKVVRLREDLTPRQMYKAGMAFGQHTSSIYERQAGGG